MDGFAVVLGLLIAGAVIAFLTWPWRMQHTGLQPGHSPETPPAWDAQDEALDDQYEAVLTALRDLDFDHAVGKVAKEDYAPLRQTLLAKAAEVMTQLDERGAAEADIEARLEAEVLALRQTRHATRDQDELALSPADEGTCPACGRMPRPGDLYCADCGTRLSLACPECGRNVDPTDLFCAGCGTELIPDSV